MSRTRSLKLALWMVSLALLTPAASQAMPLKQKSVKPEAQVIVKFAGIQGSELGKEQLRDIYRIMKWKNFSRYSVNQMTLTYQPDDSLPCFGAFVKLGRGTFKVTAMRNGKEVQLPEIAFDLTTVSTKALTWRLKQALFAEPKPANPAPIQQGGSPPVIVPGIMANTIEGW